MPRDSICLLVENLGVDARHRGERRGLFGEDARRQVVARLVDQDACGVDRLAHGAVRCRRPRRRRRDVKNHRFANEELAHRCGSCARRCRNWRGPCLRRWFRCAPPRPGRRARVRPRDAGALLLTRRLRRRRGHAAEALDRHLAADPAAHEHHARRAPAVRRRARDVNFVGLGAELATLERRAHVVGNGASTLRRAAAWSWAIGNNDEVDVGGGQRRVADGNAWHFVRGMHVRLEFLCAPPVRGPCHEITIRRRSGRRPGVQRALIVPSNALQAEQGNKKPSLSLKATPAVSFAPARVVRGGRGQRRRERLRGVLLPDGGMGVGRPDYLNGRSRLRAVRARQERDQAALHGRAPFKNPGGFKIVLRLKKGNK